MSESQSNLEVESVIRQTVVSLIHAFNKTDWATVRGCLSDDFGGSAVVHSGGRESISGADQMLSVMKEIVNQRAGINTMSVLGEMEIKVQGDSAHVMVYQVAYLYPAAKVAGPSSTSGSIANYDLRRESNGWKVTAFDVDRVWLKGEPY